MGYSREDISAMSCRTLDAVSVVDAALSSLMIYIEVLQIVVKVYGASTKVATEEGCVCREDGGDIDMPLTAE